MAESITETRGKLERARAQIRNLKAEGARVTRLATHSTLMAAGGAGAAFLNVKMPHVPGTDISSAAAAGTALTLAAALDLAGDMGDELLAIGGGMLAKASGDYVEAELRKAKK